MSKHRLFQGLQTSSPLDSSLLNGVTPIKDIRAATSDPLTLALDRRMGKIPEHKGDAEKVTGNSDSLDPLPEKDYESEFDSSFDRQFPNFNIQTKLPYTREEDEWIVSFLLKGQNIFKASSILLWKHLEAKKEAPERTYQSLKNRFLRNIKPNLFTKFSHLIENEEMAKKILNKFPELKQTVGRVKTLPGLKLPERNAISSVEDELRKRCLKGDKRKSGTRPSVDEQDRQESPNSVRAVAYKGHSIEITVSFGSKKDLQSDISSVGIYEKYRNLTEKNKLVLCAACGRHNRPRRPKCLGSSTSDSGNYVGSSQSSDRSSNGRSGKRRRETESEKVLVESNSPSLLVGASGEGQGCARGPGEAVGSEQNNEEPGKSLCVISKIESIPAAEGRFTDEDYLDATYEDTVADFRKLIASEEERLLMKRCFFGNLELLGIDSVAEMSVDSYFVRLSPNLETPALTKDYSTQPQLCTETENETSNSSLAQNMLRMLGRGVKI